MALAPTTTKPSPSRLLREMARLPANELDRGAGGLLRLRAAKRNQPLPEREAKLLRVINRALSPASRATYRRLTAKRRAKTLTAAEHGELLRLSDELELLNAERMKSLVALAGLRKRTVPALMDTLGLTSLAHV